MQHKREANLPLQLPSEQSSYWLNSSPASQFSALDESISSDVVIVGGGVAGITAAYKLKKAGLKVVVIEKNTIGSGTTGGTTGKVTTQHGLVYAELSNHFGNKLTKQYADYSQQAFNDIRNVIDAEQIACNWHTADNFVYTSEQKNIAMLQQEATVAANMGLPASFETISALPFEIKGAVKFADQAYFNAVKYVRGLAELINRNGSHVFENSEAIKMQESEPCRVKTKNGEVVATHLIIATKVPAGPLIGRLTYAACEYPVTSYIVAGKFEGNLKGMYISPDKSHYSLLPVDTADGQLLLIGGESHIPGIKRPIPNHRKLTEYAQEHFGIPDISYRWKAMDYLAYDSLPLIGKLYPWSKRAYTIGGFKKWGLNLSMVAANILVDAIVGQNKQSLELFSPHRASSPASIPKAVVKYFQ